MILQKRQYHLCKYVNCCGFVFIQRYVNFVVNTGREHIFVVGALVVNVSCIEVVAYTEHLPVRVKTTLISLALFKVN